MKKLLFILPLLVACKSTKPSCDAYGSNIDYKLFEVISVRNDTLYLEEEHVHLEEEQLCEWSPAEIYIINDTFRFQISRK